MSPRSTWIVIERRIALSGIPPDSRLLTFENVRWKGIAASRAKAQVARDAAQLIDMAQKIPIPNTCEWTISVPAA
jgi:hypothetical protein